MTSFGLTPLRAGFVAVAGVAALSVPAPAEAFFDLFFRSGPPPSVRSYADPDSAPRRRPSRPHRQTEERRSGGAVTYCVRMCDGRYFPINYRGGDTDLCKAMCPASPTRIFSGSAIADAVAKDGTSYSAIPNAFVYRARLVDDCTCNGASPLGLARVDIATDESLRRGDILATDEGFVSYRGDTRRVADFEPLKPASLPSALRQRLAETGIDKAPIPVAQAETTGVSGADDADRSDQASR